MERRAGRAGWVAFALGALYALVSAYWAAGGTVGLSTLGGTIEELGRARDPGLIAIVWVTAALKLAVALAGLAVARPGPWRRPLRFVAWAAAVVLVSYGGLLVAGQAIVEAGLIGAAPGADRSAIRWHLYLWDPWFLLWGLALGAELRGSRRPDREPGVPAAGPDPA
ncbi:DUF3995 domain-containing protein [Dactylosporangium sp. NPDC051484]|uniref:DUF3995 domain-containing protein n=1 Tax=Dactylosporangium sp. NPDC051484 TaxID=3154942 RepID=UPI00344C10F8